MALRWSWCLLTLASINTSRLCLVNAIFSGRSHDSGSRTILGGQNQIPPFLVLTGKGASLADEAQAIQDNVQRTLQLDRKLQLRWFDDAKCRSFIEAHFDNDLLFFFNQESQGNFRGDICRTAVLAIDGGFYTDLDVQMAIGLHDLIEPDTTFVSVYENIYGDNALWNALIAVAPNSPIMREAVNQIKSWYSNPLLQVGNMGPTTLGRALEVVASQRCPQQKPHPPPGGRLTGAKLNWDCGSDSMRLYVQDRLHCGSSATAECPLVRAASPFEGLRWGVFIPGKQRSIIAWSRFEECTKYGCGGNGWSRAQVQCWAGRHHTWLCTARTEFLCLFLGAVLLICGLPIFLWWLYRKRFGVSPGFRQNKLTV